MSSTETLRQASRRLASAYSAKAITERTHETAESIAYATRNTHGDLPYADRLNTALDAVHAIRNAH